MIITEKRVQEAYRTMPDAYKYYERFEGTESKPVRMYYLMDWYQEYFKDISHMSDKGAKAFTADIISKVKKQKILK